MTGSLPIFFHVPKCGGTTVSRILDRVYRASEVFAIDSSPQGHEASLRTIREMPQEAKARLRLIRGHGSYGLDRYIDRPCQYFTVLREPARRFVSHYYHSIHEPITPRRQRLLARGVTLRQLIEEGDDVLSTDDMVKNFSRVAGARGARDGSEFLEIAKDNLRRDFLVVGITEHMDQTVLLMCERLGWELTGYRSQNVNSRYDKEAIDEADLTLFRECNPNDVAFYQYATSLFESQIASLPRFEQRLDAFRASNNAYNLRQERLLRWKRYLAPLRPLVRAMRRR